MSSLVNTVCSVLSAVWGEVQDGKESPESEEDIVSGGKKVTYQVYKNSQLQVRQNILPANVKIVLASFFKHIPEETSIDEQYILQLRDINGDGLPDQVGYPVENIYGKVRPFTLSGETDTYYTVGRGNTAVKLREGQQVAHREGSKLKFIGRDVGGGGNSAPRTIFHFRLKGPDSLILQEENGAIARVIGYGDRMLHALSKMTSLDRDKVASLAIKYLEGPKVSILEDILKVMNANMSVDSDDMEVRTFERLSQKQIELLAELAHKKRGFLVESFLTEVGKGLLDVAAQIVRTKGSSEVLDRLSDNLDANLLLGGGGYLGEHGVDLDLGDISRIDEAFGVLGLYAGSDLTLCDDKALVKVNDVALSAGDGEWLELECPDDPNVDEVD